MAARTPKGNRPARSTASVAPAAASAQAGAAGVGSSSADEATAADDLLEAAAELAGDIGAAELTRRMADNIRALRKARGYSLDDMARRSGVSRASLSQVETAKTNPTIAILWKIAAGLEVPFSALLGEDNAERVSVLRRPDQRVLKSADGHFESRPLTPAGVLTGVEVYELRLAPHTVHASDAHAAGTSESLTVLVGTLRLRVGDEVHDLSAGDAACFVADVAHSYENPGRTPTLVHNVIVYAR
jgi:XRE family transcriptional regulator, regulator of sulfur utilization